MGKAFGDFVRERRQKGGDTLRTFCMKHGFDPGNISKLERGILNAPESHEKRERLASALGLRENSKEWGEFMDLATASQIESEVGEGLDSALVKKLPVFFRTLKRKRVTAEQLDDLIERIKKS